MTPHEIIFRGKLNYHNFCKTEKPQLAVTLNKNSYTRNLETKTKG